MNRGSEERGASAVVGSSDGSGLFFRPIFLLVCPRYVSECTVKVKEWHPGTELPTPAPPGNAMGALILRGSLWVVEAEGRHWLGGKKSSLGNVG